MSLTEDVRDLEERADKLLAIINEVREFAETVGERDPRSSGFIASRIRDGLPLTYFDRRRTLRNLDGTRSCTGP